MKTVIVEEIVMNRVWEEWRSSKSYPRNTALTQDQYNEYRNYLKEQYGIIGNSGQFLGDKWELAVSDEKLISLFLLRFT